MANTGERPELIDSVEKGFGEKQTRRRVAMFFLFASQLWFEVTLSLKFSTKNLCLARNGLFNTNGRLEASKSARRGPTLPGDLS